MSDILDPCVEGTVPLPGRRRIGFAEYGTPGGEPILWFHGTPGARRQIAPEARRLAAERGLRLIGVERPGVGDSTPHAYDAIVDFAADIERLCDSLSIDRFGVAALSGGGPYALACGHRLAERVTGLAILGGVAPVVGADGTRGGANELIRVTGPVIERGWRPLGNVLKLTIRGLERWSDAAMDAFSRTMPPGDQAVFDDPATRRMFQEDLILGARGNMHALLLDARLFARHWGFGLADVRVPILLRYGDADIIVPLAHGEHLAGRLPEAELRVYPGEGHVGALGASEEILDFLTACRATDRRMATAGSAPGTPAGAETGRRSRRA